MEPLLSWQTHEYEPRNHSAEWYWIVGIITLALVVISVLFGNILFGIILLLSITMLAYFTTIHPELLDVIIYDKGVQVGKKLYPYTAIQSFAVVEKELIPKLIIHLKASWLPYIIVKIQGHHPDDIHELLGQYLEEDEHVESILYKILDLLGF